MKMTLREHHNSTSKYINFTNGFPRKEMVASQGLSAGVKVHGGFFVGLHDDPTSCLTKSQRIIPPLAKRRANAFALKPRASSSRYRKKKDPFSKHKGTEKIGFTPQSVKRGKPKLERNVPKTEQCTSNTPIIDSKLISKVTRTDYLPTSTPDNNAIVTKSPECSNTRILSDVEKVATLNELIGIDEVYQKVCNGNMDSVYSLVSPVKPKKKSRCSPQYIQTSSPLLLKQKSTKTLPLTVVGLEPESRPEDSSLQYSRARSQNITRTMCKKQHSILLPLPYFPNPPKPPNTAPPKSQGNYTYPRVYPSRLQKQRCGVISSLSGWSSPSIINFSPIDLTDSKRPVSRACAPTGSIVGVQNKSQTGKVAIMAALDVTATPPATAESQNYQQRFDEGNKNSIINEKWESTEIDSLYSEEHPETNTKKNKNDSSGDDNTQEEKTFQIHHQDSQKEALSKNVESGDHEDEAGQLGEALFLSLNVTDESGLTNEVEIYDPDKRDIEKEEQVNKEVKEAQQNYEKKRQELESLLNEHDHLVQEANKLSEHLDE